MRSSLLTFTVALGLTFSSAAALPTADSPSTLVERDPAFTIVEPSNPANLLELEKRGLATFQGFSGPACDGDVGLLDTVGPSPRCILGGGRKSFYISSGYNYTVEIYGNTTVKCDGFYTPGNFAGGQCVHVKKDLGWESTDVFTT